MTLHAHPRLTLSDKALEAIIKHLELTEPLDKKLNQEKGNEQGTSNKASK